MSEFRRLHFAAADQPEAGRVRRHLIREYGNEPAETADALVALGGDGFMLQMLHRARGLDRPVYGINFGSVGFLMNSHRPGELPARLRQAERTCLYPLRMIVRTDGGEEVAALAFNEVSLFRQSRQTAKLRLVADDRERLAELVCDGIIVSTPAGSTAYNLSAHGPILPIGAQLIAVTPISAFRPRRWRGAILPRDTEIRIEVLDRAKRPVSAVADFSEVRDVDRVIVRADQGAGVDLLFDPGHNLEERVAQEQFAL